MSKYPYKSLRDWITFLRGQGQLVDNNEEVELQGEVAAISRKIASNGGPAVLHHKIKGYPGWQIFSDGLTNRKRIAWALMESEEELAAKVSQKMSSGDKHKPVQVETGPCKELKFFGEDVDLTKMPIPFMGEYDMPPFITAGISNIQDPETGWINSGIRRFQLKGKNKLNSLVLPFQHEGIIFSKYIKMNKPAPVAIIIGGDPLFYITSLMPAPEQIDEMDAWGVFSGEPLEVTRCETSDILVPATAEIIIEGEMDPKERLLEGPFSEFTGFYSGVRRLPIVNVKCITMRKDCIYQNMYMAIPTSEANTIGHFMSEIGMLRQVRQLVPEVVDVAILSSWGLVTAVAVNKSARLRKPGLVKKVALAMKSIQASTWVKNVIIMDDDTDIRNIHEVLWSLAVKFQGEKDILVIPDFIGTVLDPSELYLGKGPGITSYTVFDCTEKPPPYNEAYKRGVAQPKAKYRKKVEEKWSAYGF